MTTPPVRWPKIKAYREAVQAPELCFADADLRNAIIHKTPGGIPQVASGRSAVVFKATVETGTIAIRCFTRAATNTELRYEVLQQHVGVAPPPYLVRFAYRKEEIWVENGRYPLVEMDWVEGRPLNEWVHAHLGRGSYLINQAADWLFMAGDMLSRGLAHGDIANDNCLVAGSELKLIDYDGCYLPGLDDKPPGESGGQHFQHPDRIGHYARDMDAFPTVVVFLSLLALHDDPSLWDRFYTDKNLVFHDTDFKAPGRTPIWAALKASGDPRVRAVTAALADMCKQPIDGLPSLPQVVQRAGIQLNPETAPPTLGREAPQTLGREDADPWWRQKALAEQLKRRPAAGLGAAQQVGSLPGTDDGQPAAPTAPTAPAQPTKPTARPSKPVQPVGPTSGPPVQHRWRQRHPVVSALLIALIIILALVVVLIVVGHQVTQS